MVDESLAATVAREMNDFGGLKASMARSGGVPAAFRALRAYLGVGKDEYLYQTVFYDFSKKAGGDGMSGGPLNKMSARTVDMGEHSPVMDTDTSGNRVLNYADTNRDLLPFLSIGITETTRPKLIVLQEFYSDDIQVVTEGNVAYITFNRSFF